MSIQQKSVARIGDRERGVLPNFAALRIFRKSLGLTQEQLAALAGVDVKTVRKGECNGRMDISSVANIAAALGLELSEVLPESNGISRKSRCSAVRRWQNGWLRRNMQQLLRGYHVDAVVILPGEPLIPFSGRHQGHAEIASVFECAWSFLTSLPCRDADQLVLYSESAVALRCCGQIRTNSNRLFQLSCTHIFQFEERLISHHQIEYDTLALSRILFHS